MTDLTLTSTVHVTLASVKDSSAAPANNEQQAINEKKQEHVQLPKEASTDKELTSQSINYSVNKDNKELQLKVIASNGELVRELHFDSYNPSQLTTTTLKGVFVDDNS
jgi:hypothetical protein